MYAFISKTHITIAMTEEKKTNKLVLKKISSSGLIMDEATRRKKEARKALLALNKLKKNGGNVINQFNADSHADTIVKNKLKLEAEKAKEKGAMSEQAVTAYYDELRSKLTRLTDQLTKKVILNRKELSMVKNQVKKESGLAIQKIATRENLSSHEVKEYLNEISENTEKLGDPTSEMSDSKKVVEGINKIEEVVQDAEVHSNFLEEGKKEVRIVLARDIIPLTLKGRTIEITVGDFFHLPLGTSEEDYQNFSQHFQYLEKLIAENKFSQENYDEIKAISDKVQRNRYKKYFDLFKRGKFKIAALQAVHETWSTGKLYSLKI